MLADNNGWWENSICAGAAMISQAIKLCLLNWYVHICVQFYASKTSEDYVRILTPKKWNTKILNIT